MTADVEIAPAEDAGKRFVAATDIEDVGLGCIFLGVLQEKDGEKCFARSGLPEDQRVRNLPAMEVQVVRRRVVGFENRKILAAQISIGFLAGQDREQETQIGVVGIEQQQRAQVEGVVAGNRSEIGVELVVGLDEETSIRFGKNAGKFSGQMIECLAIFSVQHQGQREFSELLALPQYTQAVAQVLDVRLL